MTKVELQFPFELDGKTISSVSLARPKGKHLKHMPTNPGVSDLMDMAVRVSGLSQVTFDEMDAADVTKVVEVLSDFLVGGLKTGKK